MSESLYEKCERLIDPCKARNGYCSNALIDTIKAQQQEIEQLKQQNCVDCPQVLEVITLRDEIDRRDEALEQAREVLRGVFREQPSQESIEFAEYVLRNIDKALGGANSELLE